MKKYYRVVSRLRRRWIAVVIRNIRCGKCYACRSDYLFPCSHPVTFRLRRKIIGGDYFANHGDDCPF